MPLVNPVKMLQDARSGGYCVGAFNLVDFLTLKAIVAAAEYNDDYVSGVKKIGQAHARIGLEPRWYIGGYALVMEQVINAIVRAQWPSLLRMTKSRPEAMAEAISAFVKAAMLDMDFAISVYLETLDDERRMAEVDLTDSSRTAVARVVARVLCFAIPNGDARAMRRRASS